MSSIFHTLAGQNCPVQKIYTLFPSLSTWVKAPTSFCNAELRGVNRHFLWEFGTIRGVKERAPREFKPITCFHCQQELIPTSSSQKYHSECRKIVKLRDRKKRYHSDLEFRQRLLDSTNESSRKNSAEKLRLALTKTGKKLLRRGQTDLMPLFTIPNSEIVLYFSPKGYLAFRPGIKAEFPIDPYGALEYGYKRITHELRKIARPGRLKK